MGKPVRAARPACLPASTNSRRWGGPRDEVDDPGSPLVLGEIDLRVLTQGEAERMTQAILGQRSHHPDVRVQITGGMNRPPMERTERTGELFERAKVLARELGFALNEALVGGGSDGNFCAALGVPVLDGLGAVGGGAHAVNEHIEVADMPRRAALVARLVETV